MSAHPHRGAQVPGLVTPESDEAAWQGGSDGAVEKRENPDCAAAADDRKRLATLRAVLALHGGHVVHKLADGSYLVTWRAFSRECRDLAELEAHARRVGAMP